MRARWGPWLYALLFLASAVPCVASPLADYIADERAVFLSDEVLNGAVADIGLMWAPELRALVRYFSECEVDENSHDCEVAYAAYMLEFGGYSPTERPIDVWMTARSALAQARKIHHTMPDVAEALNEAKREITLKRAIRERFHTLQAISLP